MLTHWIWLSTRQGLSDRARVDLLQHFPDPEEIFHAAAGAFDGMEGISQDAARSLDNKDLTEAEQILAQCRQKRLQILTWQDAGFPRALKSIPDPPVVLYYKGTLPEFDALPMIGVVGTRKASLYGVTAAKRMGYQIARCGGVVVSGMAFGIDGVAMQAALSADGQVVGVLGCGADIVYPASNRDLFADVEKFGCILSEYPPGTPPRSWNFPRRNRLISGLSSGVLVVEAPEKSGALITANLALEQGRDVFVVPGNIDVPSFVGSNRLLRDGAILAGTGWDVMGEYEARFPGRVRRDDGSSRQTGYSDEVARIALEAEKPMAKVAQNSRRVKKSGDTECGDDKKVIDNPSPPPYSDVNKPRKALSPDEQAIVDALAQGERLVDDVIAETGFGTGKMLALLTMMEIKGIIRRLPGKRIVLK